MSDYRQAFGRDIMKINDVHHINKRQLKTYKEIKMCKQSKLDSPKQCWLKQPLNKCQVNTELADSKSKYRRKLTHENKLTSTRSDKTE